MRTTRYIFLYLGVIAVAGFSWYWYRSSCQLPPDTNVIIVLVDALRADHLGCYGYPRATTPHLDAAAKTGTVFTDFRANSTWTRPSVATLLTAAYPSRHQARNRNDTLRQSLPSLASALHEQGYATGAVIANGNVGFEAGFGRDFDNYILPMLSPAFKMSPLRHISGVLNIPLAEEMNAVAIDWLTRRAAQQPFFLLLFYHDPHAPYAAIEPYNQMFDPAYKGDLTDGTWETLHGVRPEDTRDIEHMLALYDGDIKYWDDNFNQFYHYLGDHGYLENTLLIVTADHGEEFYEHGLWGHGWNIYGETTHIPLIFIPPRGSGWPAQVSGLASMVDLAPTILDLLAIPPPGSFQGTSFKSALRQGETDASRPVFYEEHLENSHLWGIEQHGHKIVFNESLFTFDHFDLTRDPGEQQPLPVSNAENATAMAYQLARWMHTMRTTADTATPAGAYAPEIAQQLRSVGYMQ